MPSRVGGLGASEGEASRALNRARRVAGGVGGGRGPPESDCALGWSVVTLVPRETRPECSIALGDLLGALAADHRPPKAIAALGVSGGEETTYQAFKRSRGLAGNHGGKGEAPESDCALWGSVEALVPRERCI